MRECGKVIKRTYLRHKALERSTLYFKYRPSESPYKSRPGRNTEISLLLH